MPFATIGTKSTFNAASTQYVTACELDATHFVVVYQDAGDSSKGKAVVGTISGSAITFGAEYAFESSTATYMSVCKIDATHFIIVWHRASDDDTRAVIATVSSGDNIAYDTSASIAGSLGSAERQTTVGLLDSTHFVVAWKASGTGGVNSVVNVFSGTTISSAGTAVSLDASDCAIAANSLTVLDSTHFVVTFKDASTDGKAIIGVVSAGTTITGGSQYTFKASTLSASPVVKALDSTHFVVAYSISTDVFAILGTVSGGTVISYATEITISTDDSCAAFSMAQLSATDVVVCFKEQTGANSQMCVIITNNSGTLIPSAGVLIESDEPRLQSGVAALTSTTFAAVYSDNGGTYGKGSVGTVLVGPYTLALGVGSFTLSGQITDLIHHVANRILAMGAGAFSVAGQAIAFTQTRILTMGAGAFTLTGKVLTVLKKWRNRIKNATTWTNRDKN